MTEDLEGAIDQPITIIVAMPDDQDFILDLINGQCG